jgi:hypothetical protein
LFHPSERRPVVRDLFPERLVSQQIRANWPKRWYVRPWTSLRKRRAIAVRKGVRWMRWYLKRHWSPEKIGMDGVYIFLELALTSTDRQLQKESRALARQYARKMRAYFLVPGRLKQTSELLEAIDLLSEAKSIGIRYRRLYKEVLRAFRRLPSPDSIFGAERFRPELLLSKDLFDLLINVYIMEKVQVIFPGVFSTRFGLPSLMPVLRKHSFVSYKQDHTVKKRAFEDDAFLVTHIALVYNHYGRLRLFRRDIPRLLTYIRGNFSDVLAIRDVEVLSEFVDIYRGLGLDETKHLLTRVGTIMLLESQHPDGSWGDWKKHTHPYDAIHYTWCAVLGLRERFFLRKTPFAKRIRAILKRSQ